MIKYQGGRFDKPDRLFKGIKKEWNSAMTNPGNVKELIPEFYQKNTDFLENKKKLDLGIRQNGKRVEVSNQLIYRAFRLFQGVKVPKWAKDYDDYLRIN